VSPHYDRYAGVPQQPDIQPGSGGTDDGAIDVAAEALRQADLEAVQTTAPNDSAIDLERLSIDELRKLAADLDLPDRSTIAERSRLIAAIRERR